MATLIVGNDNANTLSGTGGDDVIYGFNPNGPQKTVTSIDATRVAISELRIETESELRQFDRDV